MPTTPRRNPLVEAKSYAIALDDPDWRPDNHVFTDAEMRDRFMRFGGMDAMSAWRAVGFVRDWYEQIDWDTMLSASVLGHGVCADWLLPGGQRA